MKNCTIAPMYSDSWLKQLRQALTLPNFITAPTTKLIGVKSDYEVKQFGKRDRSITDKEWSNLQIARALIESRN